MGAWDTIRHRVRVRESVCQSIIRQMHAYVEANGGYIEHVLRYNNQLLDKCLYGYLILFWCQEPDRSQNM